MTAGTHTEELGGERAGYGKGIFVTLSRQFVLRRSA